MLQSFNPRCMLFRRAWNMAFRRALSTEQYQSALIIGLLCWRLNRIPCLPEMYYSAEILIRIWFCLTEFDWCGSLDNEEADALARAGSSSAFVRLELCLPLEPSSVGWRERKRKPNPSLTRYLLRLPRSKLRILVGLITGHCTLSIFHLCGAHHA
jgi:hypothetical protein